MVRLRIDREIRRALDAARRGRTKHELEIIVEPAVRQGDVVDFLLRHNPHVLHFSGHAHSTRGLLLEDGSFLEAGELAALLPSFPAVRLIVLNACNTLSVATALAQVADYTVAMESAIEDEAALVFSAHFYAALSYDRSIPFAFDLASRVMDALQRAGNAVPHLLVRPGAIRGSLAGEPIHHAGSPADAHHHQNNVLSDVSVSAAEVINEADGASAASTRQDNRLNGVTAGSSLSVKNTIR